MGLSKIEEGKYLQTIDDFRGGLVTNIDPAKMGEDSFTILENVDMHHDYEGSLLGRKAYIPVGYNSTTPSSSTKLNLTAIAALYWKKFKKVLSTDPIYYFYIFYNSKYIKVYKESILNTAVASLTLPFNFLKTNALNFYNNLYVVGTLVKTETTLIKNTNPNLVIVRDTVEEQGCPPCPQTFKVVDSGFEHISLYDDSTRKYAITFLYDNNQESYIIPFNTQSIASKDVDYQSNINSAGNVVSGNPVLPNFQPRVKTTGSIYANLLTDIPIGNSRVIARKIYIVKASPSTYFHLIGTLDNNTDTSFIDLYPDSLVGAPSEIPFVYRPPNAKLISTHKESLLMANTFDRQYSKESEITNIAFEDVAGSAETEVSEIGSCSTDLVNDTSANGLGSYYRYTFYDLFPIIGIYNDSYIHNGGFISEFKDYVNNLPYEAVIDGRTEIKTSKHIKISYRNYNKWSGKCVVFRNCTAFIRQSTGDGTYAKFYYGNCTFTGGNYVWSDCPQLFKVNDIVTIDRLGISDFSSATEYTIVETGKDAPGGAFGAIVMPWFKVAYTGAVTPAVAGDVIISKKLFYQGTTKINTGSWGDTQTYYDKNSDISIMEVDGAFQAKFLCNLVNEERPYMLMSSEVGKGDIFDPSNERPVGFTDNTGITAIAAEENAIIIWKEDSLWKINTNSVSKDYWTLTRLSTAHGLSSDKSLAIVNDSAYVFWYQGRCYHWFSSTSIPIYCSAQINSLLPAGFVIENSYYDNKNDRILFFISYIVTAVTYNKILIYDLKFRNERGLGKWYIHYGAVAYEDILAYNLPLTAGFVGPVKEDYFIGGKEFYKYDEYTRATDFLIDSTSGNYASAPFITKFQTKEFDTTKYEVKEISMKIINTGNASSSNIDMIPVSNGTSGTKVPVTIATITGNNRISGGTNIQGKNTISLMVTIRNFIKPIVRELSMIMNLIHNVDARKR